MNYSIIRRIASKELSILFASPIAYLFIGTFLAVTLFIFFWVETFFARNIADIRPLFSWMPILLAFLASTLTMKMWSEEKRIGTIEAILTQPIATSNFIMGKFLACVSLLLIAVAITVVIPIFISFIAYIDWGPVIAGYIATILLGCTYIAIGLFISSKTDNQIVSLIGSVAICSLLLLIGSDAIGNFFSIQVASFLDSLSTGARFESITRGVVDFRDFWFYLSLIALFLYLNYHSIEKLRWPDVGNKKRVNHSRLIAGLMVVNLLVSNVWLAQIHGLRYDVTAEKVYSISDHSKQVLGQLREPLLIKGVFSSKTHPLLAPLIPQLVDLLEELEVLNDKVRVEIFDPASDPEREKEIGQEYNIQPVPLQIQDRYQASVVSIYFNVIFLYGDSKQSLSFNDLIEVKVRGVSDIEVTLRNPEFDMIRTIKKLIQDYQTENDVFTYLDTPVTFTGYISDNAKLPSQLVAHKAKLDEILEEIKQKGGDKFDVKLINPEQEGQQFMQMLAEDYGILPLRTNLLSNNTFYYNLLVGNGNTEIVIPLDAGKTDNLSQHIDDAIKRFVPGLNKTVAVFNKSNISFNTISEAISQEYNVSNVDLASGSVDNIADTLFVVAPENLTETELFAIDQFLMRGGSVVFFTSPSKTTVSRTSLQLRPVNSGLDAMLKNYGVTIGKSLVMDQKNVPFPVPVMRDLGGFQVQEIKMIDYPFFSNMRDQELNQDHPMTSNIPFLTLTWAYPITVNAADDITVVELFKSSDNSWLSTDNNIIPRPNGGNYGFTFGSKIESQLLGVALKGRFNSFFADKDISPIAAGVTDTSVISSIRSKSPEGSQIIVFSSNDFVDDQNIQLVGAVDGNYQGANQLVVNTASYLLEDEGLLEIRARKHYNLSLPPIEENKRLVLEYLNYGISLVLLIVIALLQVRRYRNKNQKLAKSITH